MLSDSSIEDDDAQEQTRAGFAFIGAVRDLVTSERAATRSDLLLAGIMQSLRDVDRDVSGLVGLVNMVWPATSIDAQSVREALNLGVRLGLVRQMAGLDGGELWSLTAEGLRDVQQHESWLQQIRARAVQSIQERAVTGLQIEVSDQQAELWLEWLVRRLLRGIRASQSAYAGDVERVVGGRIQPRGIDRRALLDDEDLADADRAVKQFLQGLVMSAVDPLDTFGNELLSHITTGCVLHAYLAGRDTAAVLARVGAINLERAILDTPVLLDLVGPARLSARTILAIQRAIACGWEVVVFEHSLQELTDLLERDVPNVVRSLQDAHAQGIREEWYASLTDDQLPALFVEAMQDGTYKTPEQLIVAGKQLAGFLGGLGVVVRPDGNDADADRVANCKESLQEQLAEGNRTRAGQAIERDARTMAATWRRRRRQTRSQWPGAWVITRDRVMAPAYHRSNARDPVSLTLTMSQWMSLIAISAKPAELLELASASADQLIHEAMWVIPTRFPPDVALSLALKLAPRSGGSDTDMRVAQLTIDEVLDDADAESTAVRVASKVMASRVNRLNSLHNQHAEAARLAVQRAEKAAETAEVRAKVAREAEAASRAEVADLRAEANKLESTVAWKDKQLIRFAIGAGIAIPLLVGLVVAARTDHFAPRGIDVVVLLGFGWALFRWVRESSAKFWWLLLPCVVGALNVWASLSLLGGK